MWNFPCIPIEDPFELSYNLGEKKNGKLGKNENYLLYSLYKRVKESKKAEVGKSDLNSSFVN